MKPRSCAKTSTSLLGGIANAVLNFRGRYVRPYIGSSSSGGSPPAARGSVDPELMVRPGAGKEAVRDGPRDLERPGVQAREVGIRVAHHVSVHVAAGRERVEERRVHLAYRRAQVPLDDAMELE